jgi:hypothetical protein
MKPIAAGREPPGLCETRQQFMKRLKSRRGNLGVRFGQDSSYLKFQGQFIDRFSSTTIHDLLVTSAAPVVLALLGAG